MRFLLLFLSFSMFSCTMEPKEIPELKKEIAKLQQQITALQFHITAMKYNIENLENFQFERESERYIHLSTDMEGYAILKTTEQEIFYVMLTNVKKYGNGYKLKIKIGNPHKASYKDFKYKITYGISLNINTHTVEQWKKEQQVKEGTINTRIQAGEWNSFEITLAPCSTEQLGYIKFELPNMNTVFLGENNAH